MMRISNAKEAMVGKSGGAGYGVGDKNFLAGNFHGAYWRDAGAGDDSFVGACPPQNAGGHSGNRIVTVNRKNRPEN